MTEMQARERRATEYRVKVYRRQLRRRARRRRSTYKVLTVILLVAWLAVLAELTTQSSEAAFIGSKRLVEQSYELPGVNTPATTYASVEGLESLGTYRATAYCACVIPTRRTGFCIACDFW